MCESQIKRPGIMTLAPYVIAVTEESLTTMRLKVVSKLSRGLMTVRREVLSWVHWPCLLYSTLIKGSPRGPLEGRRNRREESIGVVGGSWILLDAHLSHTLLLWCGWLFEIGSPLASGALWWHGETCFLTRL